MPQSLLYLALAQTMKTQNLTAKCSQLKWVGIVSPHHAKSPVNALPLALVDKKVGRLIISLPSQTNGLFFVAFHFHNVRRLVSLVDHIFFLGHLEHQRQNFALEGGNHHHSTYKTFHDEVHRHIQL